MFCTSIDRRREICAPALGRSACRLARELLHSIV